MAQFIELITTPNDRWDLIAYRVYNDPWAFERIIAANPDIPIRPTLPGGLRILVPVITRVEAGALDESELPPWKRSPA